MLATLAMETTHGMLSYDTLLVFASLFFNDVKTGGGNDKMTNVAVQSLQSQYLKGKILCDFEQSKRNIVMAVQFAS